MIISYRGMIGVASTSVLLLTGAVAASQAQGERSLLGVRIWDSRWRDVLSRHGQPTRIEVGAVVTGAGGAQAGGIPGMGGMGGGGGLPGVGGMGPGMSMPGMGGGMGSGGGMGGAMGKMRGAMGMPGMPGGMSGGGGMSMPGMPGMGGGMGSGGARGGMSMPGAEGAMGMPGMGGMGGIPGMGGGAGDQTASSEEEVTWVYDRGGKIPVTNFFLFNRDGRLIQAQSFGYSGGAVTARGLKLGDTVAKIFGTYGWTGNMVKDNAKGTMTLDYGKEKNVAFQLLDRHDGRGYRVVGITVGLTDKRDIPGNRDDSSR